MSSAVEVCNIALGKLGEPRITSLTDDTRTARDCNAHYEFVRRRELRKHIWNFAKTRVILAPDSAAPAFEYDYQFSLPSDWIRTHPRVEDTDWVTEGRKIYTNLSDTLELLYIRDVEDVNQWDTLFLEVVACSLAVDLAEPLTQSSAKKNTMSQEYKAALVEARKVNAFEHVPEEMPEDPWISVRR